VVTTYVDSSVLVASYIMESHSAKARRALAVVPQLPYTPLHHLEVRNAFRMQVGWKRMSAAEASGVIACLDDDVFAGRLAEVPVDLYRTFARAEAVSAQHAADLLCRGLDVLHVAAALELRCERFITLDARQARLAAACGLKTIDLSKRRARAGRV
jgi:predicted nucleic acid-binding protein